MKDIIYLDNAATERVSERAAAEAVRYSRELFYNPGGRGASSVSVMKDIAAARETIARVLGGAAGEILFLSGATEANNLVLRGAVKRRGAKIVITEGEHASVYNTAKALGDKYDVAIVPLDKQGAADGEKLLSAVDENTALVSVIHINNETGAVNDINALARRVKEKNRNCLFHSDGVQAFCKTAFTLSPDIDFYTVSAHKTGGLKGLGALYIKSGARLNPLITGGKQENYLRAGTENVPGIMAFKACAEERSAALKRDYENAARLNGLFIRRLGVLTDIRFNGAYGGDGFIPGKNSPYIISVSFKGLKAETLAALSEEKGVVIGLGSACSAAGSDNRVLKAMGISRDYIDGSIRVSFSNETTEGEVERASEVICETVKALRE